MTHTIPRSLSVFTCAGAAAAASDRETAADAISTYPGSVGILAQRQMFIMTNFWTEHAQSKIDVMLSSQSPSLQEEPARKLKLFNSAKSVDLWMDEALSAISSTTVHV